MQQINVSVSAARRFLIRSFALDGWQNLPDPAAALNLLGFVQMDSINVCGRIHDLILLPRVRGYQTSDLHALLYHPPRRAFEYYFPNLCILPISEYPYFVRAMRKRRETPGRWQGLLPDEIPVAERILAQIDRDGAMRSRATGSAEGHTISGWGSRATIASQVIDKLYLHGTLSISHRINFERWFDRTERVLHDLADLHTRADDDDTALPDPHEAAVHLARLRLSARRLFRPDAATRKLLGSDAFVSVAIEGAVKPWFALAEDTNALRSAENAPVGETLHLLAPLDPLVYDRDRTRDLFDFDYTWEVYTPQVKRRWGYYVLPILHGERLVGRVDPKMDRKTGTLHVHALHWEPEADVRTLAPLVEERLRGLADFLQMRDLNCALLQQEKLVESQSRYE